MICVWSWEMKNRSSDTDVECIVSKERVGLYFGGCFGAGDAESSLSRGI